MVPPMMGFTHSSMDMAAQGQLAQGAGISLQICLDKVCVVLGEGLSFPGEAGLALPCSFCHFRSLW